MPMRTKEAIEKTLRSNKPYLESRFGVRKIGFFGSYVRGEATEDSDIDVLVELSEPLGWELVDLREFLEDALGVKVDLVTVKALKPQLSDAILREVVYA